MSLKPETIASLREAREALAIDIEHWREVLAALDQVLGMEAAAEPAAALPPPKVKPKASATPKPGPAPDPRVQKPGTGKGGNQRRNIVRARPLSPAAPRPPLHVTQLDFPDNPSAFRKVQELKAQGYRRREPGETKKPWRAGQFDVIQDSVTRGGFIVRVWERHGDFEEAME